MAKPWLLKIVLLVFGDFIQYTWITFTPYPSAWIRYKSTFTSIFKNNPSIQSLPPICSWVWRPCFRVWSTYRGHTLIEKYVPLRETTHCSPPEGRGLRNHFPLGLDPVQTEFLSVAALLYPEGTASLLSSLTSDSHNLPAPLLWWSLSLSYVWKGDVPPGAEHFPGTQPLYFDNSLSFCVNPVHCTKKLLFWGLRAALINLWVGS